MTQLIQETCPRCSQTLENGFARRDAGLSFVEPEKLERHFFLDEDLAHAGLSKFLPTEAEYFRSYLCRACELYLIDYRVALSHAEAEQLAKELKNQD